MTDPAHDGPPALPERARCVVRPAPLASVPRRLFGALVEHMGRDVYGGIVEPGHPAADASGFRRDVLDLVRELGVTTVRYPGGNFVSGYRWEDGVGPVADRPKRLDLAWRVVEPNTFGTDEFVDWCRLAGIEPMLTLNLATRGTLEAVDLVEYANHHGGTALADRRVANGHPEPHGIRIWCLGNELDGPWQLGHRTAAEYARIAAEAARGLRMLDPALELVACGSSGPGMPTFGAWEEAVLREANGLVDAISLHFYADPEAADVAGDAASHLASPVGLERYIGDVAAIVDAVGAANPRGEPVWLSVDEWNVWYLQRHLARGDTAGFPDRRRLSEDEYTAEDAVVVGGLLVALLKHVDRVQAACIAQLVNAIAPIHAEPDGVRRLATFHPFALTAAAASGGRVHLVDVEGPALATRQWGTVPAVDAVAVSGEGGRAAAVLLVNRDPDRPVVVDLDLGVLSGAAVSALTAHPASGSSGTAGGEPGGPVVLAVEVTATGACLELPAASWTRVVVESRQA